MTTEQKPLKSGFGAADGGAPQEGGLSSLGTWRWHEPPELQQNPRRQTLS